MNAIIDIKYQNEGAEPVDLPTVKSYIHVDFANDNHIISLMIGAARRRLEAFTGRSLVEKTVTATLDLCDSIELPYGPVVAISSVTRTSGSTVDTLTTDDYTLTGTDYPVFAPKQSGIHTVTYTAGYSSLPGDLKLALLAEVAYRYENRGDENVRSLNNMAKSLAFPYRRIGITS